jgi:hypothetical protein
MIEGKARVKNQINCLCGRILTSVLEFTGDRVQLKETGGICLCYSIWTQPLKAALESLLDQTAHLS